MATIIFIDHEARDIMHLVASICLSVHLYVTVSGIGLEFFSQLEFDFPGALHLQFTVEQVLQHPSHDRSSYPLSNEQTYSLQITDSVHQIGTFQELTFSQSVNDM